MAGRGFRRQVNLFRNLSNWWVYYGEKLGLFRFPLRFVTRRGIVLRVPAGLYPEFKSIFLREHYLEGLDMPLREGAVVIDIGANVGFFSLFAASKWGARVFSYEPVGANYGEMMRNVGANPGISVKCVRAALSGASGTLSIVLGGDEAFPTTASVLRPSAGARTETVEALTLGDAMDREGLGEADLVKMDCEGSEFSVLYGSSGETLSRIGQMAIEVHADGGSGDHNAEALGAFLTANGFTVRTNEKGTYLWARRV